MKYVFDKYARRPKYLRRAFVVEEEAGFVLLLLVGLLVLSLLLSLHSA